MTPTEMVVRMPAGKGPTVLYVPGSLQDQTSSSPHNPFYEVDTTLPVANNAADSGRKANSTILRDNKVP